MMSEALLNCPFCGSNQLTTEGTKSLRHVYCRECAARGPVWGNNYKAQSAWNNQGSKERDEWMDRALAAEALADRRAPPTCGECGTEITSKVYCHECSGLLDCSVFCVTCGDHGCPDCRPGEVWS